MPHHLLDMADPWEDFTLAWFAAEARRAGRRDRGPRPPRPARRRHRPLPAGGGRRPRRARAVPRGAGHARGGARHRRAAPPAASSSTRVAAARMEPTNRRRVVRALEVTLGSGRPFSSFGPASTRTRRRRFHLVGVALPHEVVAARIAARYRQQMADGFLDEVARLLADPRGLSRTARQALGYRELIAHLDGELPLDEALDLADPPHPAVRPAPAVVVPARPPHPLARRPRTTRSSLLPARVADGGSARRRRDERAARDRGTAVGQTDGDMRLTKHHGLGNDFLVVLDTDASHPLDAGPGPGPVRPAHRRRRRRPASGDARPAGRASRRRARMELRNADGSSAEMSGNGIRCLAQALRAGRWPGRRRRRVPIAHRRRPAHRHGARTASTRSPTACRWPWAPAQRRAARPPEWTGGAVARALRGRHGQPPPGARGRTRARRRRGRRRPRGARRGRQRQGPRRGQRPPPHRRHATGGIAIRTYERGVGPTRACGTGACASAAAARAWGLAGDDVPVDSRAAGPT